jgi:hypothetical protein
MAVETFVSTGQVSYYMRDETVMSRSVELELSRRDVETVDRGEHDRSWADRLIALNDDYRHYHGGAVRVQRVWS